MIPGFKPPESGSARCALKYFGTAFVFLALGVIALAMNTPLLASGLISSPRVVGGLHFITLGWLTLSIFGALQVFIGVALGSKPFGKNLAFWVLGLWTLGSLLFPIGFAFNLKAFVVSGAFALGAGITLFSIQLIPALWSARRGQLTRCYTVIALVSLWSIWGLGACAAVVKMGIHPIALPPGYFSAHILIAVFGWVGAMIAGVGSHLIPMFALSNKTPQWPIRIALPVWAVIPFAGLLSAFFPDPWTRVGWTAAAVVSALWCVQVTLYILARMRRERDAGLLLAVFATAFLPIAWAVLFLWRNSPVFVGLLLLGWLMLFTLGIYHRVIPFLVWFVRFSSGLGRGRVPRVKDLLDERLSFATAALGTGGTALWAVGLGMGNTVILHMGSCALLAAWLCGAAQVPFLRRSFSSSPAFKPMEVQT